MDLHQISTLIIGKIEEFYIANIPIYIKLDEDAQYFMETNGLRTDSFEEKNNETWFDLKFGDGPWKSDPNSHNNMNIDSDESVQGSKVIEGSNETVFEAANIVGKKHTKSIIEENTKGLIKMNPKTSKQKRLLLSRYLLNILLIPILGTFFGIIIGLASILLWSFSRGDLLILPICIYIFTYIIMTHKFQYFTKKRSFILGLIYITIFVLSWKILLNINIIHIQYIIYISIYMPLFLINTIVLLIDLKQIHKFDNTIFIS